MESVTGTTKFIITAVSYVVVLFCTLNVTQIIVINSIAGSTVGNFISTILPATFILILGKSSFCSFEKHSARFFIIFGTLVLIFFIKFQIIDVFFTQKSL